MNVYRSEVSYLNELLELDYNFTIENIDNSDIKVIKTKYGQYFFSGLFSESVLFKALIHFYAKIYAQKLQQETK